MKQLIIGFVLGITACVMVWSFSAGEAHAQSRGGAERGSIHVLGGGGSSNDGGIAGGGGGCVGDLNDDGTVGVADLLLLLANWGPCPCPNGQTDCGGICVDTGSDPDHCGGCGIACGPGETCTEGQCAAACPDGLADCNGVCVDLNSNVNHCGACNVQCPNLPNAIPTCTGGSCGFTCQSGFADCNGNPADGCEVNLLSDNNNCGCCGCACPPGTTCVNGACVQMFTWYEDLDGDGWGNCAVFVVAPTPPPGWVSMCGDCDDTDPTVYPGAPEICNDGKDNNCNGLIDCDDPECAGDPSCQ